MQLGLSYAVMSVYRALRKALLNSMALHPTKKAEMMAVKTKADVVKFFLNPHFLVSACKQKPGASVDLNSTPFIDPPIYPERHSTIPLDSLYAAQKTVSASHQI